MNNYDTVVIGAGVFGAWTAYRLRLAGKTVALLDAYGPGNSRSSSGGESRIIRMSYGADEIYTRWSARSLSAWRAFLDEVGAPGLFHQTGVLWTSSEGDPRAADNLAVLARNGVVFEQLTQSDVERRFRQLRFPGPITAVLEPESGVLLARRCVQAVVREAVRCGVDFIHAHVDPPSGGRKVTSIRISRDETIGAGELVYACGPWLPKVFPGLLGRRIRVTRQEIFFFGTAPSDRRFASPVMPAWLDYSDPRRGYAVPDLESRGFKLAFDRHGPEVDPDTQERVVRPEALAEAQEFLRERFPEMASAPVLETRVCQYESTPNGDFLIDRHPEFENVWIVGGGSGHGFKHGPAVGEYVEQVLAGTTDPEPRFALDR